MDDKAVGEEEEEEEEQISTGFQGEENNQTTGMVLHWGVDQLGQRNRAIGGFGLDNLRPRSSMVFGRKQFPLLQFLGHPVEDVAVLGVDHRGDTLFPRRQQDVQDLIVAELQCFVGHVYFQ